MRKILISLLASNFIIPMYCFAQFAEENDNFPLTSWVSKDSFSPVTIQNSEDVPITVFINVFGNDANSSGVNVEGCGNTAHINPGSSSMCDADDPEGDPVITITSDSANPAKGTYQISKKNFPY